MKTKPNKNFALVIPILALIVIAIQLYEVKEKNLSRWKGGGFGMYSEIHFSANEVWVSKLNISLDSLKKNNKNIRNYIKNLKLIPSNSNLKKTAQLLLEISKTDTIIVIQVWKPLIDMDNSSYSREIINEIKLYN